jgi:hypothetical protein
VCQSCVHCSAAYRVVWGFVGVGCIPSVPFLSCRGCRHRLRVTHWCPDRSPPCPQKYPKNCTLSVLIGTPLRVPLWLAGWPTIKHVSALVFGNLCSTPRLLQGCLCTGLCGGWCGVWVRRRCGGDGNGLGCVWLGLVGVCDPGCVAIMHS